jgi:ATP-dependent helicase/nuclease subunit B
MEWGRLSEADSMQLASEVVDVLVPQTRSSILNRTARYRFLTKKLKRAVGRAIAVLGEHARRSRFVPVGLEVSFGPGGELPGITVELPDGLTLHLIGRIDRVDQSVADGRRFLRVIDYKSGPKTLALADVWNGLNLQLLVYLDVVVTNAEEWLGERAEVGGVFYYQVADPFVTAKRMLSPQEVAQERSARLKMKGLMLADKELAALMDEQLLSGSSDLVPISLKKDGSFTKHSAVATADQFSALQSYVRARIAEIAKRMADGEIAISPYAQGPFLACHTCSYRPVCHFDAQFEGNAPRTIAKWKDDQVWTMIEETVGSGSSVVTEDENGGDFSVR